MGPPPTAAAPIAPESDTVGLLTADRARDRLVGAAEHLYRTTMGQRGVALLDTGLTTFGMVAGAAAAVAVGALRVAGGRCRWSDC